MMPINMSTDDIEASNSRSGPQTGTGMGAGSGFRTTVGAGSTGGESEMGPGAGNMAGSETAARPPPNDHIADIGDLPNTPGEEVPENDRTMFVRVTAMLEPTASGLGKLEIVWMILMVQGGFAFMLQMKDFVFIIVTLLFEGIRVHHRSMRQSALFYWFQLISAMTTTVLSGMQLYAQDFGHTEKTFKANWDFALNLFYVVALAEALMLLAWCYSLRRQFGNSR